MYTTQKLHLTDNQVKKLRDAIKKQEGVTLRLKNIPGNVPLMLTKTQVNRLNKNEKGTDLNLSKTQIKAMTKDGGILPLLAMIPGLIAAAAPAIAKTAALGALGGAAGLGAQQAIKAATGKGLKLGPQKGRSLRLHP